MAFGTRAALVLLCCCSGSYTVADDVAPASTGTASSEVSGARVLAAKKPLSVYGVEHKELVVEYTLYNIGDKPALSVTLDDRHGFPADYFALVAGSLDAKWERLAAGANVSHAAVLRPTTPSQMNVTAARVTYYSGDTSEPMRTAASTSPGEMSIYELRAYERRFSPHYSDWAVFGLTALPCLALPAALWFNTYTKYTKAGGDAKKAK